MDYDAIQQWASEDMPTEKSLGSQCAHGVYGLCLQCNAAEYKATLQEVDRLLTLEDQKEPKGAQGTPVSPRRQIPANHSTWAKPLLTDHRHNIVNYESGRKTIVFAPAEVL